MTDQVLITIYTLWWNHLTQESWLHVWPPSAEKDALVGSIESIIGAFVPASSTCQDKWSLVVAIYVSGVE